MNDLPLHPNDEMASRYLDGDLEPDERALAEANSEVMSQVRSFGMVRSLLADTAVVTDDDVRSVTAALAGVEANHDRPIDGEVVAFRRRQRRVLTWVGGAVAAAAVAVVAVGVGIGPRLGDPNSDHMDASQMTPQETVAVDDRAVQNEPPSDGAAQSESAVEALSALESPDADMSDMSQAGSADLEAAAPFAVPAESAAPSTDVAPAESPARSASGEGYIIASPDDLRWLLAAQPLPQPSRCAVVPGTSGHGTASYDDGSGTDQFVEVLYDAMADLVRAVDADTCAVVLTAERQP